MEVRNAADSVRFCRMTTEEIRGFFSSRVCLLADTIKLIYSDVDRAIVGSAVPVGGALDHCLRS
jgi:5-keto 4-deoxyuronate isomerase